MTPEERFERIERVLSTTAALASRNEEAIKELIAGQRALQGSVAALIEAVAAHVASANARMEQLDATLRAFLNSMRRANGHGPGPEL